MIFIFNLVNKQDRFMIIIFLTQMISPGMAGMSYMLGLNLKNLTQPTNDNHESKFKQYPRQKSYLIESDWVLNAQNGGMILISKDKKKNQGKIIKFVLKKFVTTGSFMGISFPVFAMKPESILQTYAKSISAAPLFFQGIQSDATQRLKKLVAFTFTFSRLFSDMDKPFNPVLGQTFQALIAGGKFSAEQTSHHPPQSSFYYEGNGFHMYATLELTADIGVNSAHGTIIGEIHIKFNDGGHVFGRILSGQMSGFIIGENKFRPLGSCYAYDPVNKIICSYKREKKDLFLGEIGILKQKYQKRFQQILNSNDRFIKFQSFPQKDYQCIIAHMSACWSKNVSFNQKVYVNFDDPKWLPFQPTYEDIKDKLLKSDSRNRKDIKLRGENLLAQSQAEKQKIENLERYFRKLRKGQKNPKIQIDQVQRMQQQDENQG